MAKPRNSVTGGGTPARPRNSVTGGGHPAGMVPSGRQFRANPTGPRYSNPLQGVADFAGAVGGVGAGIGRSIGGAIGGIGGFIGRQNDQVTGRTSSPVSRAMSDESRNALSGVLGKKRP